MVLILLSLVSFVFSAVAVDHLVNTASLGHTFYFEEATDTNVFPILMVSQFALFSIVCSIDVSMLIIL